MKATEKQAVDLIESISEMEPIDILNLSMHVCDSSCGAMTATMLGTSAFVAATHCVPQAFMALKATLATAITAAFDAGTLVLPGETETTESVQPCEN